MRILLVFIAVSTGFFFNFSSSSAQSRADSIRVNRRMPGAKDQERQQLGFYRRSLKVDSAKAASVMKVQAEYKAGMKVLEADKNVDMETRRVRIKALMDERNRKLGTLLTADQQSKMIPPGEREAIKTTPKD
ncbi:hypothetical protein BDE36_2623 [Arcticibacter tournemirensis]|uniref:Periplasmic heavy metal sensor n=1 Tax=Arcticibacter tournemirensis TaxID=699437 RepID=A0A5M9GN63_9SPHI|nr:hypothetical protein [Arcticibacter tournemirensis]KAA8476163.1 hypothetical protein F1649_20455 [Arcticibacter tournemirensis]TQM50859.1 hypothetical protein BDE36_2623 [Arcticibacter tournemirensis]